MNFYLFFFTSLLKS